MNKKFLFVPIFLLTVFIIPRQSLALSYTKPTPPSKPAAPTAPEPPEISGDYVVPEVPGLHVRVFAHPPIPTPPARPGATVTPTESALLVCSLSDPDNLTTVGATGWHLTPGTIQYRLNPSSLPSGITSSNLDQMVNLGFGQLSQGTGDKVFFSKGPNTGVTRSRFDGQNVITWGRTSGSTLGVTYVWYYPSTGAVAEVDTIMNKGVKWSYSGSNVCADTAKYDAADIMVHELGHWMGLDDMYDAAIFQDATMYGYGSKGEVKKTTLSTGDKAALTNIYSPL